MATKLRGSRLESELDKARTQGSWGRVAELVKAAKSRQSGLPSHQVKLIEAEAEIELFLESHADILCPRPSNSDGLRASEERLRAVLSDEDAGEAAKMEAHLLLAKCAYAKAAYEEAFSHVEQSGMDRATTQFRTLRALRLVAESYVIKGLCMETSSRVEKTPSSSSSSDMESRRRLRVLSCFEKAADFSITYVDELEKALNPLLRGSQGGITTPTATTNQRNGSHHDKIGEILEYCLERVAKLCLKQFGAERKSGDEHVGWYRRIMECLASKSTGERLQQRISWQLAELLLRAFPDASPIKTLTAQTNALGLYMGMPQRSIFVPNSLVEEMLLLLLLCEALCTRDIVLGRTDDVPPWQAQAMGTTKAVYNLLTIILSSLRQFQSLSSVFERSMKFANDDAFIWQQFALSVVCRGGGGVGGVTHALRLLERSTSVAKNAAAGGVPSGGESTSVENAAAAAQHLVAAQLCIQHARDYSRGVSHADSALKLAATGVLRGRAILLKAIALEQEALSSSTHSARVALQKESGVLLETAVAVDPHDYLSLYYCALHYAHVRDLESCRERVARSLEMKSEQPCSLLLLALVFSAEGDLKAALEVMKTALDDFPTHYALRVAQLHLLIKIGRVSESLEASAHLLDFWSSAMSAATGTAAAEREVAADSASSVYSSFRPRWASSTFISASTGGGGSQNGMDIADSGVFPTATSEAGGASSLSGSSFCAAATSTPSAEMTARFHSHAAVWVALAELFLAEARLSDVAPCVEQALQCFPNSHAALYLKARVLSARAEKPDCPASFSDRLRAEAKDVLLCALSLCPEHSPSLAHMASIYAREKNMAMAEHYYRELVRVNALDGRWWQELGDCLLCSGRAEEALSCFQTASRLHHGTPIIPFEAIPLIFPNSFT